MKIGYGISVQESDDPCISIAEEDLAQAGISGAFWVDFLPILKYVPSWYLGAGFQKKAARWISMLWLKILFFMCKNNWYTTFLFFFFLLENS